MSYVWNHYFLAIYFLQTFLLLLYSWVWPYIIICFSYTSFNSLPCIHIIDEGLNNFLRLNDKWSGTHYKLCAYWKENCVWKESRFLDSLKVKPIVLMRRYVCLIWESFNIWKLQIVRFFFAVEHSRFLKMKLIRLMYFFYFFLFLYIRSIVEWCWFNEFPFLLLNNFFFYFHFPIPY